MDDAHGFHGLHSLHDMCGSHCMHGLVYMHDSIDLHGSPGITIQIYGSDGMCSSHGMYDPTSMHDLICFAQHALPCFTTEAPSSSVQLLGEALLDDGAAFLEPLRRACQGRKTEDGLHKAFLDYHLTLPLKQRDILLEGNFSHPVLQVANYFGYMLQSRAFSPILMGGFRPSDPLVPCMLRNFWKVAGLITCTHACMRAC